MRICICPNCNGLIFNIIEQSITKKRKKSFITDGKHHYHNQGIHQELLKCIRCGCIFIFRKKDICQSCDYNKRYKPQMIIIKKGKFTSNFFITDRDDLIQDLEERDE